MYIRVNKKGRLGIRLWVPLSLLKSRFVVSLIRRSIKEDCAEPNESAANDISDVSKLPERSDTHSDEIENGCSQQQPSDGKAKLPTQEQLTALYRALRSTVKSCGHFDLVRVSSADGENVCIRI